MTPGKILPANLAVLKARFPAVLKRLRKPATECPNPFIFQTKMASSLMMQRGDYSFCPYGDNNPEMLVKRWFDNLNLAGESLYAITGFGDGSHLRYFLKESGTGINLLAAEKDPALIRETLSRFDLSDLLSHQRFILGTGELDDDYFASIQGAALTGVNDVNSIVFSPLHSVDEAYYDKARNELVRQYLVIRL